MYSFCILHLYFCSVWTKTFATAPKEEPREVIVRDEHIK